MTFDYPPLDDAPLADDCVTGQRARALVDVLEAANARSTPRPRDAVLRGARELLVGWWAHAAGYGVTPDMLDAVGDLAPVALDAVELADARRQEAQS